MSAGAPQGPKGEPGRGVVERCSAAGALHAGHQAAEEAGQAARDEQKEQREGPAGGDVIKTIYS